MSEQDGGGVPRGDTDHPKKYICYQCRTGFKTIRKPTYCPYCGAVIASKQTGGNDD